LNDGVKYPAMVGTGLFLQVCVLGDASGRMAWL
jgi:hypothetical protein